MTEKQPEKCPDEGCTRTDKTHIDLIKQLRSTPQEETWEKEFAKGIPPSGMHPSAGDFNETGESKTYRFGYKVLRDDEIFTVVDWGNIKSFIRTLLDRVRTQEREAIEGLRKREHGDTVQPNSHGLIVETIYEKRTYNQALDDVLKIINKV